MQRKGCEKVYCGRERNDEHGSGGVLEETKQWVKCEATVFQEGALCGGRLKQDGDGVLGQRSYGGDGPES